MQPGLRRYHEIVQKALAFVRGRSEPRTTVADVARHASCSPSHLRLIFRTVTGKGVLPHLNDVRVEKAKRLLLRTSLDVGEVAFAVGCEQHSSFTRLFRRATGTSPTQFREAAHAVGEAPAGLRAETRGKDSRIVLRDDLASGPLPHWWYPVSGDWRLMEGYLQGASKERLELNLVTPLPENFRFEFEVRIERAGYFRTLLKSSDPADVPYCSIDFQHGIFRLGTRNLLSTPETISEPGRWYAVRLVLNDSRIGVALDGKSVFSHRDLFPPPYSQRSWVYFSDSGNAVNLRSVRLFDLGFSPLVPAIRQGDAFYNAGLFAQAREFYVRHLRPSLPREDGIELRFKIALCWCREGQADLCREWVQTIESLSENSYWRRECDLLLLRIEAEAGHLDAFARHVRRSFSDPLLRDGIRPIVGQYRIRMMGAGFYDRALRLSDLRIAIEKEDLFLRQVHRDRKAHILKNLKRLAEADRILLLIVRSVDDVNLRVAALVSLSDIGLLRRNTGEARRVIARVRAIRPSEPWCDYQEGACLRAERKFREAADILLSIRNRYPESPAWRRTAETAAAEALCCLGDVKDASALIARMREEAPERPFPNDESSWGYVRVSHLVEKRYEDLAALLLPEARRHDDEQSRHGQEMVTAGILLELAGKPEQARKVWGEAGRRFPPERCYFWGTLAKALVAGKPDVSRRSSQAKPDHLESMKLFYRVRSEMFYLAGLLYEHRGDAARARRLFALSVKEDPTLNWPAHLASTKLSPT